MKWMDPDPQVALLLGRRVRLWLDGTRDKGRTLEGVVEAHELYSFVIPAPDGRVPYVINLTRVLDVWEGGSGGRGEQWVPTFDGRTPRKDYSRPAKPKRGKK